jgi:hypothetical protein
VTPERPQPATTPLRSVGGKRPRVRGHLSGATCCVRARTGPASGPRACTRCSPRAVDAPCLKERVVVTDEAGMVPARYVHRLAEHICVTRRKLVLVGDLRRRSRAQRADRGTERRGDPRGARRRLAGRPSATASHRCGETGSSSWRRRPSGNNRLGEGTAGRPWVRGPERLACLRFQPGAGLRPVAFAARAAPPNGTNGPGLSRPLEN